jgi:DNA-binding NarL/FixJ family response regulator
MIGTRVRIACSVSHTARTRLVCHDPLVSRTVLIVDDHPSFRASARALLEDGDFQVIGEAADGRTALDLLKRLRPDLVLLDVQLPDMTGFDVCVECGDVDDTAVVLVSSRDGADFGDLIERCGARGFIAKGELTTEALASFL